MSLEVADEGEWNLDDPKGRAVGVEIKKDVENGHHNYMESKRLVVSCAFRAPSCLPRTFKFAPAIIRERNYDAGF